MGTDLSQGRSQEEVILRPMSAVRIPQAPQQLSQSQIPGDHLSALCPSPKLSEWSQAIVIPPTGHSTWGAFPGHQNTLVWPYWSAVQCQAAHSTFCFCFTTWGLLAPDGPSLRKVGGQACRPAGLPLDSPSALGSGSLAWWWYSSEEERAWPAQGARLCRP